MNSIKKAPPKLTYESNTYLTLNTKSTLPITPPENSPTLFNNHHQNQQDSLLLQPTTESQSTSQRSTSSSTTSSSTSSNTTSNILSTLTYVGHVGELPNDYLYCLPGIPTTNPPSNLIKEVKEWLGAQEGISGVEIMIPRKRVGRNRNWDGNEGGEEEDGSSI